MTVKVTQFGPRRSLVTVADYRIAAEAGATTLEIETVGTDEKQKCGLMATPPPPL
jgi:hypothetical protein